MNVKGASESQIREAANEVGVKVYNLRAKGIARDGQLRYTFTIKTEPRPNKRTAPRWQRIASLRDYRGRRERVIPGAVCWHGHREFMRALYRMAPNVVIRTAVAVYSGSDHFEATHEATYYTGGQRMGHAVMLGTECRCASQGGAR